MKLSNINAQDVIISKRANVTIDGSYVVEEGARYTVKRVNPNSYSGQTVVIEVPETVHHRGGVLYVIPKHFRKPRLAELRSGDHVYLPNGGVGERGEVIPEGIVCPVTMTISGTDSHPVRIDHPAIENGFCWVQFKDIRVTSKEVTPHNPEVVDSEVEAGTGENTQEVHDPSPTLTKGVVLRCKQTHAGIYEGDEFIAGRLYEYLRHAIRGVRVVLQDPSLFGGVATADLKHFEVVCYGNC